MIGPEFFGPEFSRPEFSRPVVVAAIGSTPSETCVEASETERLALARRLGVPAVAALACRFVLHRPGAARVVFAEALLTARVVQTSVVSLDEFEAEIVDGFAIRFVPAGSESGALALDEPDEIPYDGDRIDLGEAAAEQLALVLDPFPRKPGEVFQSGTEDGATPFSALRAFRSQH